MQTLTVEEKAVYRFLLQTNTRHMQPQSEAELEAIRHIAYHQFALKRLERIQETLHQIGKDEMLERYPRMNEIEREVSAYRASIAEDKLGRALNRDRRSHEASVIHYQKVFRTLRRDIPLVPPEPVSVAREMQPDQPVLPSTVIVDEAVQHAARVQSEPSYRAPEWVDKLLKNKELVKLIARRDKRRIIDGRLEIPWLPRAA